jgi:hypothetical protein
VAHAAREAARAAAVEADDANALSAARDAAARAGGLDRLATFGHRVARRR